MIVLHFVKGPRTLLFCVLEMRYMFVFLTYHFIRLYVSNKQDIISLATDVHAAWIRLISRGANRPLPNEWNPPPLRRGVALICFGDRSTWFRTGVNSFVNLLGPVWTWNCQTLVTPFWNYCITIDCVLDSIRTALFYCELVLLKTSVRWWSFVVICI